MSDYSFNTVLYWSWTDMLYPDIYLGFWLLEHCPLGFFLFIFFLLKKISSKYCFCILFKLLWRRVLGLHICSYTFEQINVHKGERFHFHFSWTLSISRWCGLWDMSSITVVTLCSWFLRLSRTWNVKLPIIVEIRPCAVHSEASIWLSFANVATSQKDGFFFFFCPLTFFKQTSQ